ncbi:hypothetical protein GCM10025768_11260 [Microbacterium pseudoresistens]|uniref:NADPH-dependent ferric siderophore reductase n=1 Tax=Microbacterium pseudoresistens TaxID=640634 RepID=A0A7Y9JPU4_9MICO|nr:SIP domain-containing protein [Microbacterium pseudoresistens]NYD55029.1 NADPH-dependent ferric siderophore reductase [Microbacterium pseudoresistens]
MTYPAPTATSIRAQRRASRRRPRAQHLVTADENSLVELEALIATLPLCATGRVFVEVADADQIAAIAVPPRMTITWLPRASRSGEPGSSRRCATGAALTRAVTAWADEMLCDADEDAQRDTPETHVTLLGGYLGTADIVDHLKDLGVDPAAIHAPERYGLSV